jgi:hypothetical protein
MTRHRPSAASTEVSMNAPHRSHRRQGQRGQMIVIAVMSMVTIIGGVALVLEAGNAYAHQREVQGGADSVANAGATVIAQRLGGASRSDGDVAAATNGLAASNGVGFYRGYYTDVHGVMMMPNGNLTTNPSAAAQVGDGVIPPGAQGVNVIATQTFETTFGRVIGFNTFSANADATSVAGALTGGQILPSTARPRAISGRAKRTGRSANLGILHRGRSTSCPCARPMVGRSWCSTSMACPTTAIWRSPSRGGRSSPISRSSSIPTTATTAPSRWSMP